MLSICIPTYRTDVAPLAETLLRQMSALPVPTQLLIFDDGSPYPTPNHDLLEHPGLTYRELGRNRGRSAVRNLLATAAAHDWLLFLDADMAPNPDLLASYLTTLREQPPGREAAVIVGGHHYRPDPPTEADLLLHWTYGTHREARPADVRARHPYLAFHSANFALPRGLHSRHPFDESVTGYGHEDTLWGQQLATYGVPVVHTDNSAEHLGLEGHETFLAKQRRAIGNLKQLRREYPTLRTRLTDLVERFPGLGRLAVQLPEDWLLGQTKPPRPNLRALDLLKLKWYCSEENTSAGSNPVR